MERPLAHRHRYAIEAYNLVGEDPALYRWWLGMEFTQWIHGSQEYGHDTELKNALVFDEMLNIYSKELYYRDARVAVASPKRLFTMGRALGLGILGGTQNVLHLETFCLQNTATFMAMACRDMDEALAAAKPLHLPREKAPELQNSGKGKALVYSAGWDQPVWVTIPEMKYGDYPSSDIVRAHVAPELSWIRSNSVIAKYPDPDGLPIDFLDIVSQSTSERTAAKPPASDAVNAPLPDHIAFLSNVESRSDRGLKQLYTDLGCGIEKGNRILKELKDAGYVRITEVPNPHRGGGRPRLVPELTPAGAAFLRAHQTNKS